MYCSAVKSIHRNSISNADENKGIYLLTIQSVKFRTGMRRYIELYRVYLFVSSSLLILHIGSVQLGAMHTDLYTSIRLHGTVPSASYAANGLNSID
jgi:hypothetical protein